MQGLGFTFATSGLGVETFYGSSGLGWPCRMAQCYVCRCASSGRSQGLAWTL